MFDVKGKVAIVTGGASGIGFSCTSELLRNGLKAATIADINEEQGRIAEQEIEKEFGAGRVKYVKTDIADKAQFEEAFEETIKAFGNIDIVINNAGFFDELNWEKLILVNVNGTINGNLLAIENYFPKYRSGPEAVVVNISSIAAIDKFGSIPIYAASKHAIVGLGQAFGVEAHYNRTKVKVLTVCPGYTSSLLVVKGYKVQNFMGPEYFSLASEEFFQSPPQSSEFVAKYVVRIIQEGETGSVWVVENSEPAYELDIPNRKSRVKAVLKKID